MDAREAIRLIQEGQSPDEIVDILMNEERPSRLRRAVGLGAKAAGLAGLALLSGGAGYYIGKTRTWDRAYRKGMEQGIEAGKIISRQKQRKKRMTQREAIAARG